MKNKHQEGKKGGRRGRRGWVGSRDRDSECLRGGISNETWVSHSFAVTNGKWNEKCVLLITLTRRKPAQSKRHVLCFPHLFPSQWHIKVRILVFWCGMLLEAVMLLFLYRIVHAFPPIARAGVARRATGLWCRSFMVPCQRIVCWVLLLSLSLIKTSQQLVDWTKSLVLGGVGQGCCVQVCQSAVFTCLLVGVSALRMLECLTTSTTA